MTPHELLSCGSETWVSLLASLATLVALEIVLGIDNIVFLVLVVAKLPVGKRDGVRRWGIGLAVWVRVLLLLTVSSVARLTAPFVMLGGFAVTGRSLILLLGGAFLVCKSVLELSAKVATGGPSVVTDAESDPLGTGLSVGSALAQIVLLDIVFSLDSVITAVGLTRNRAVMIVAIVVAAAVIFFFSGAVSRLVESHPSLKILALAFLALVGALLILESWDAGKVQGWNLRNSVYFAIFFSLVVELLNIRAKTRPTL